MSVTQEITEGVGATAYAPRADNTANGRTTEADAVASAEAAQAAAGSPSAPSADPTWAAPRARHEAEVGRLLNAIVECRSTTLSRAIETALELKVKAFEAAEHDEANNLEGPEETWPEARDALQEAAYVLAEAPIANATDALVRSECFIDAVGRNPKTGLPEDDGGDQPFLIECMKSAIACLALREPDTDDWDDAVGAYRKAVRDVDICSREDTSLSRAAMVEDVARITLAERTQAAVKRRDTARTQILGMEPPHVDGLLVQLELLGDRFGIDLGSYESRETILGDEPMTAGFFWGLHRTEALRRGLALVAVNTAKLRDRSYPSDWSAILDGFLSIQKGGRDTVRAAYDAKLLTSDLISIVLDPRDGRREPVLLFHTIHGQAIQARPGEVWKWEKVK